jgi:hypothetical protein
MPESEPDNGVVITFHDGYLHITHPENFVVLSEEIEGLWQNLAEACRAFGCNRVLNEGNVDLSKLKSYDTYIAGSQAGGIRGLRMACLFYGFEPDEQSEFFKTVASNRGAKVEFFRDRAEALKWLGVTEGE